MNYSAWLRTIVTRQVAMLFDGAGVSAAFARCQGGGAEHTGSYLDSVSGERGRKLKGDRSKMRIQVNLSRRLRIPHWTR